jgi:hypothetical protein
MCMQNIRCVALRRREHAPLVACLRQDYIALVIPARGQASSGTSGRRLPAALECLQVSICEDVNHATATFLSDQRVAQHLDECREAPKVARLVRDLFNICAGRIEASTVRTGLHDLGV